MTPHILTRKTRLRPRNFLINDANGLLQQYRPLTADNAAQRYVRSWVKIGSDYCPLGMSRLTHNVTSPPSIDAMRKVAVGTLATEHPRTHHANKGVTAINTALALAQEAGLDLVEIAPNSVRPKAAR